MKKKKPFRKHGKKNRKGTIFDDTYRTVSAKATRLMIPLINHMFGKAYPMDVRIRLLPNEAFLPGSRQEKYITDALFRIGDDKIFQMYIMEEQTNASKDMPIRLYEYMLAHANKMLGETCKDGKIVLPSVGVLNLRGENEILPVKLVHDGKVLGDVTMKSLDLQKMRSVDDLAENNLFCLMPYYLFMLEKRMEYAEAIERDRMYLEELEKYAAIVQKAVRDGVIDSNEGWLLNRLREKVRDGLHLEKKGLDVRRLEHMGGRVLNIDFKRFCRRLENRGLRRGQKKGFEIGRKEGREEGRKEGRKEGRMEGRKEGAYETLRGMIARAMMTGKEEFVMSVVRCGNGSHEMEPQEYRKFVLSIAEEVGYKGTDRINAAVL